MSRIEHFLTKNRWWIEWVLFIGLFWLFIVNLQLNRGLTDLIPGYHYWRKTDTYAQILNYYYNGLNFFDHGLFFNQMKSGGKAVAEFPLFYYFIAIQLKIFGNYFLIIKLNWLIMLFFGMFSIYKTSYLFTKHFLLSTVPAFVLFLSPIFTIYCLEFLPDPIALNFSLIGIYFLAKYYKFNSSFSLFFAIGFISLAGLMKPFFLIPFIAFILTLIIRKLVSKKQVKINWLMFLPIILVAIWFSYVNWYNSSVNSHYFLSSTKSFWSTSPIELAKINLKILNKWWSNYLHPGYWSIFVGIAIFIVIDNFKYNKKHSLFIMFSILGSFSFLSLFYGMLKDHDYYIFPVMFILPLVSIYAINYISKINWPLQIKSVLGGVFILILYLNSSYSFSIRNKRLSNKNINATGQFAPYQNIDNKYLTDLGIDKNKLVITYSDKSPSYALILLNRKGWSGYQTFYRRKTITDLMSRGAEYLIINKALPLKRDSVAFDNSNMLYLADTNQIYFYKLIP